MLSSFFSPVRFGVLLALLLLVLWRWMPRWMRMIACVPIAACIALSLPLVANQLVRFEESRVPMADACAASPPATIVVLSGGITRQPADAADFAALGEYSLRRLFAAVALYRAQHAARLVISGGEGQYGIAESALMARLAEQLGVPGQAITLEARSHSTWQNAQFTRELEPAVDQRIWLVTSALHMPRAAYAFREAGFSVCAWPADTRFASANSAGYYLPSTGALDKSDAAIHEMLGEAAYRMGWMRSMMREPWSRSDER
jgi:uncharacterized SAM-binding protein YcdF (DUF218 family)